MSYHYAPPALLAHPDPGHQSALVDAYTTAGHRVATGNAWTTDAFFRETSAKVAQRVGQGAVAVDMEAASLAAIAAFRGVRIGHALYLADTLHSEQWDATELVERDVEAPEVFQVTEPGLWDGRPSLGGVWVAHPDVTEPERVIVRNEANGKFVIGALFRRERDIPGPRMQASSDAAAALGMLAAERPNTVAKATALTAVFSGNFIGSDPSFSVYLQELAFGLVLRRPVEMFVRFQMSRRI